MREIEIEEEKAIARLRKGECEKMDEARECERTELETRKGKEESVRSEEERECMRS